MLDAQHLSDIWPIILLQQVGVQRRCRSQPIRFEPAMPFDGTLTTARRCLHLRRATGEETAQRPQQMGLIVLDAQKRVPLFSRMVCMTSRVV